MENDFTQLPSDPAMLMSVVNMKLRDSYRSLDELLDDMHFTREPFLTYMASKGWEYNEAANKFW